MEEKEEETEKKRWPAVFLIHDSTIQTKLLGILQEKLLLSERDRTSLSG